MKIENSGNVHVLDTLVKTGNAEAQKGTRAKSGNSQSSVVDKVEISGARDQIEKLKKKIESMPPTREEKVAAVKEAVQSGTYKVDGHAVAKAMLKSQLLDEVL
jgi:negative regulator of flagellin synthesis FlgM